MAYTDPSTITFATNENPLASAKLNSATNDQFLAVLPDGVTGNSWSPTLEAVSGNPATSATAGVEYTIAAIQFCWVRFVISTAGSGIWLVDLPSTASGVTASSTDGAGQAIGNFTIRDDAPGWVRSGAVVLRTSSQVAFVFDDTGAEDGMLTHNNIRPWAAGDVFSFYAQYPIA